MPFKRWKPKEYCPITWVKTRCWRRLKQRLGKFKGRIRRELKLLVFFWTKPREEDQITLQKLAMNLAKRKNRRELTIKCSISRKKGSLEKKDLLTSTRGTDSWAKALSQRYIFTFTKLPLRRGLLRSWRSAYAQPTRSSGTRKKFTCWKP